MEYRGESYISVKFERESFMELGINLNSGASYKRKIFRTDTMHD